MLSFIGLALLVAAFVWFFPLILSCALIVLALLFCLAMAAVCWVKELFTSNKKPTR